MRGLPSVIYVSSALCASLPLQALVLWVTTDERLRELTLPLLLIELFALGLALGLLKLKKWSYWCVHIHAAFCIVVAAFLASHIPSQALLLVTMTLTHIGSFVGLWPHNIRFPYLAGVRGFRQHRRHSLSLPSVLETDAKKIAGETLDLSESGAFVSVDIAGFSLGQRIIFEGAFRNTARVRIPARIMSVNDDPQSTRPKGLGLAFKSLTTHDLSSIRKIINESRQHVRLPLVLPAQVRTLTSSMDSETIDVSMGGCFLRDGQNSFAAGDRLTLHLSLRDGDVIEIVCEVAWTNNATSTKPMGLALQFIDMQKDEIRRLQERLQEAGSLD